MGNDEKFVKEKRRSVLFYKHYTRIAIGGDWRVSKDDEDGLETFLPHFKPHCTKYYIIINILLSKMSSNMKRNVVWIFELI